MVGGFIQDYQIRPGRQDLGQRKLGLFSAAKILPPLLRPVLHLGYAQVTNQALKLTRRFLPTLQSINKWIRLRFRLAQVTYVYRLAGGEQAAFIMLQAPSQNIGQSRFTAPVAAYQADSIAPAYIDIYAIQNDSISIALFNLAATNQHLNPSRNYERLQATPVTHNLLRHKYHRQSPNHIRFEYCMRIWD